jgi:hypothetical protein
VKASYIEDYVNDPGSRHRALYRFMARVACRAIAKGYAISSDELVGFARQVDQASARKTNPQRWKRIGYEAQRALQYAAQTVSLINTPVTR